MSGMGANLVRMTMTRLKAGVLWTGEFQWVFLSFGNQILCIGNWRNTFHMCPSYMKLWKEGSLQDGTSCSSITIILSNRKNHGWVRSYYCRRWAVMKSWKTFFEHNIDHNTVIYAFCSLYNSRISYCNMQILLSCNTHVLPAFTMSSI